MAENETQNTIPSFSIITTIDEPEAKGRTTRDGVTEYFTRNKNGTYTCIWCGYTFLPRKDRPKRCASCQKDLYNWRIKIFDVKNRSQVK